MSNPTNYYLSINPDAGDFRVSSIETPAGAVKYKNITAASSINLVNGGGLLKAVIFNVSTTARVVLYDNTTHGGTIIGTIDGMATKGQNMYYDANFATGLTISAVSSPGDITVSWV